MAGRIRAFFISSFFRRVLWSFFSVVALVQLGFSVYVSTSMRDILADKQYEMHEIILGAVYERLVKYKSDAGKVLRRLYEASANREALFRFTQTADFSYRNWDPFQKLSLMRGLALLCAVDDSILGISVYRTVDARLLRYDRVTASITEIPINGVYQDATRIDYEAPVLALGDEASGYRIGFQYKLFDPSSHAYVGNIVFEFDGGALDHAFKRYDGAYEGRAMVLLRDGRVLYDSDGSIYGYYPYFQTVIQVARNDMVMLDQLCVVSTTKMPLTTLVLASIIPVERVDGRVNEMLRMVYSMTLLAVACVLMLCVAFGKVTQRRTRLIMDGIHRIRTGDLSSRIAHASAGDEFDQIAEALNTMSDELQRLIRRTLEAQLRQKNAEIASLQARINPHFLSNTLEIVRMRATREGNQDLGETIQMFATMFRNMTKGSMLLEIREELDLCMLYMDIVALNFENSFSVSLDVDEASMGCAIVRNTLQPILENCVLHGMDRTREDNHVLIQSRLTDGLVMLHIEDNGSGMGAERLEKLKRSLERDDEGSGSIGLINVNNRIKLVFGPSYGLVVSSEEGRGTCVTMRLPAMRRSELEKAMLLQTNGKEDSDCIGS